MYFISKYHIQDLGGRQFAYKSDTNFNLNDCCFLLKEGNDAEIDYSDTLVVLGDIPATGNF